MKYQQKITTMDFENIYSNTPESLKLKFLDAIFTHNNKLREEFIAFVQSRDNERSAFSYDSFLEIIHVVQTSYKKRFEMVDTENPDWENYHSPYSGYIEEWEAYQYASEQEIEAIFNEFHSDAVNKIIGQRSAELIAMLIGLYEATQDAEIPDEIGTFEDINEYLLSEHTNTLNTLIEKILLSAVSRNVIRTTFELFFKYCDSEYPGNPHFANHFEHLLIALTEKSDNAEQLLSILDQSTLEKKALPELVLLLNKKAGNNTEWLQSARQFYRNNKEVAKQLLEYYFETDKDAFLKTANELFPSDNYLWAEFLQQYVSPQLDKILFVNVFWQLTIQQKEIKYYNKIREYLSGDDLNNLLKELEWEKVFAIKILETEKRYDNIKAMVEQSSDNWKYAEMIAPILTIYPEFCFKHIKNRTLDTLQNKRGRHTYQRIASWLSLTENIPGFENEKRELIHQLYNYKPNLPALKDEMRKAGLMS